MKKPSILLKIEETLSKNNIHMNLEHTSGWGSIYFNVVIGEEIIDVRVADHDSKHGGADINVVYDKVDWEDLQEWEELDDQELAERMEEFTQEVADEVLASVLNYTEVDA